MISTDGFDARSIVTSDPLPELCGVVGGGRMGAGIAHALLLAGVTVRVIERDAEASALAYASVAQSVTESQRRGVALDVDEVLARLDTSSELKHLTGAGLVVEAVVEDPVIKASLLREVELVVGASAVIASNTSSISITQLGDALRDAKRFLGLHFFNPVPASVLVEVVVGARTSGALASAAQLWVRQMGKTPIVVNDRPGFASSRLGVLLGLEAIRMVEEGVASAPDIDTAMTLGYGHPTGPLRLTDIVGLDVRLGVAEYLFTKLGERFAPPPLLREMVSNGDLGRKTGHGFYTW